MLRNSQVNLDFSSQTCLQALQKPCLPFPAPLPPSLPRPSPLGAEERGDPSSCHVCPCGQERQQTPSATPGLQTSGATSASIPQPGLQPCTLGTGRALVWGRAPCRLLRTQISRTDSCFQGAPSREAGTSQSVKVTMWGPCHEPEGELYAGCPTLARGSAVTESAVCAHQTVSRGSRAPSHSSRPPAPAQSCPQMFAERAISVFCSDLHK